MNTKNVYLILFVLILNACARVPVVDAEWCGDMGELGASCFNTLSEGSRDIEHAAWEIERIGMVCTKPESFIELKKTILKLCKVSKRCSYDVKKKIISFSDKIESFIIKLDEGTLYGR